MATRSGWYRATLFSISSQICASLAPPRYLSVRMYSGQSWLRHERQTPLFRADRSTPITLTSGLLGGFG